eukprot:GFUD01013779.1.p1 GENE.GFUD01013779.1~~GFUD01013779.1.p1  ORF type:complete len:763 (+),score=138.05 GFUD01013779.1:22-2289(+)
MAALLLQTLLAMPGLAMARQSWENIQPVESCQQQTEALQGLLARNIPEQFWAYFELSVAEDCHSNIEKPYGSVRIVSRPLEFGNNKIVIIGNSGVSAAFGLNHYLKYFANSQITWNERRFSLEHPLPAVDLAITSLDKFRYYLNECTFGYSFPWWGEDDWTRHVDWMALNGINMPLATTGQEAVQRQVYLQLGLTEEEIDSHFTGPAFLPWGRMGNIKSWGGPLSSNWHLRSIVLQHSILDQMRSLGMTPVLPGFAGHVPDALLRIYPNVSYHVQSWLDLGFSCNNTCTILLDPRDPIFKDVGVKIMDASKAEFGTDHLYSSDPFNEMDPDSDAPEYISEVGQAIFSTMLESDPEAVWVMQGWMFYFAQDFWKLPQAEALLTSVPQGSLIILDLDATEHPQYERLDNFFGQPFIFNMLDNFGGNMALYGRVEDVVTGPAVARRHAPNMIGTGLTPEGIFTNYVMYDLMSEMGWSSSELTNIENIEDWFAQFGRRRYGPDSGLAKDGLIRLCQTAYNCTIGNFHNHDILVVTLPSLNTTDYTWYSLHDILDSLELFVEASDSLRNISTFQYDLADLSRQFLVNLAPTFYQRAVDSYNHGMVDSLDINQEIFLDLLNDLENVLSTQKQFLLGTWLESAKTISETPEEKSLYEFNACNQITLWGPDGQILDYAAKQWSGLVSQYYARRWALFFDWLALSLAQGEAFSQDVYYEQFLETIGRPFCSKHSNQTKFPVEPIGDIVDISREILQKWAGYVTP